MMSLNVIIGPMFASKSTRLREYIVRHQLAGQSTVVFKPKIDQRYSLEEIVTHDLLKYPAMPVGADESGINEISRVSREKNVDVIGVDEAQFFSDGLARTARHLADEGKTVYVAALNLDFRGEPFQVVKELLPYADKIIHLSAVCRYPGCGREATRTQRIVDGRPASYNDPIIIIGGLEKYEARCRMHHVVADKPEMVLDENQRMS